MDYYIIAAFDKLGCHSFVERRQSPSFEGISQESFQVFFKNGVFRGWPM